MDLGTEYGTCAASFSQFRLFHQQLGTPTSDDPEELIVASKATSIFLETG